MKRKICVMFVLLFLIMQIFCFGCGYTKTDEKILTLTVYADSDSQAAQRLNAEVASAVGYYLSGELGGVNDYKTAYVVAKKSCAVIKQIACAVLRRNGCGYAVIAEISDENFADGKLFVKLGTGEGNGFESKIYPVADDAASSGIVYKSLIAEIVGYTQKNFS